MTIVSVRRATPEDAPGMMRVHLSCLNNSYPAFYTEVALQKWKSLLELKQYTAKTEGPGWCYVAVIESDYEEEIVGFGYLNTNEQHRIPKQHGCDVQIETLYVSAFHHKCGIGKKLMQAMEDKAKDEQYMQTGIVSSLFAVPFYKRMGYSIVQEPVWLDISKNIFSKGPFSCEGKIMTKDLYACNKS